jgi:hypothetical protein
MLHGVGLMKSCKKVNEANNKINPEGGVSLQLASHPERLKQEDKGSS